MSEVHEQFNLNRKLSVENKVDPTGKKWTIHGERGSALVHARPEPDRVDAQIPKEFAGKWTSVAVLTEKIDTWLGRQWDHADRVTLQNARKNAPLKQEELLPAEEKQTPEESLAALDPEIKAELGIEEEKEPEVVKPKASKKKASKKKAGK
jgi:hypothetical protein